jgi:hypothetical protein
MLKLILILSLVTGLLVAVMLAYMCFMAAERNGWRTLAERFRLRGRFDGEKLHLQSAILNGHAFHLTLVIGASNSGLFLRPALPVRLFHAPLLIPWSAFEAADFVATHSRGRRLTLVGMTAPDGSGMALDLSEELCGRLVESLRGSGGSDAPVLRALGASADGAGAN